MPNFNFDLLKNKLLEIKEKDELRRQIKFEQDLDILAIDGICTFCRNNMGSVKKKNIKEFNIEAFLCSSFCNYMFNLTIKYFIKRIKMDTIIFIPKDIKVIGLLSSTINKIKNLNDIIIIKEKDTIEFYNIRDLIIKLKVSDLNYLCDLTINDMLNENINSNIFLNFPEDDILKNSIIKYKYNLNTSKIMIYLFSI